MAVLALPGVAPEPHLNLPPVHHDPVVVPGDTVPGSQHEPVRDESSATGPASHASPGTSECGLNKGSFYPGGLAWSGLASYFQFGNPGPGVGLGHNSSEDSLCGPGGLRPPVAGQQGGPHHSGGETRSEGRPAVGEDVSVRPPDSREAKHPGQQALLLLIGLLAVQCWP